MKLTLAAVLLLASCSSSAPAASPSTFSVAPSPGSASPTPSPAVSLLGNCRLPLQLEGSPPQVAWLNVPGGTFTPDPASAGHMSPDGSSIAWDAAISGWVPTNPLWLSPDGTRYVAPDTSASIHIVDARSGATIEAIPPKYVSDLEVFTVIGYTRAAIFLVKTGMNPQPGLWQIDTSSWALSRLSDKPWWSLVDGSVIWGTRLSAAGSSGVERLDSSTGVVQEVLAPGQTDWAIEGLAGSGVLVMTPQGPLSAEVVNSDGSVQPVAIPPAIDGSIMGFGFRDGPEILFASSVGLVGFDQTHGFQKLVSRSDLGEILGGCATA